MTTETAPPERAPRSVYALTQLAVAGFELTTALSDGELQIELGPSTGVVGTITNFAEGTVIDATTEESLSFHRVATQRSGGGGFAVSGPLEARRMAVHLALGGVPLTGHVSAEALAATHLELGLGPGEPYRAEGAAAATVRIDAAQGSTTVAIDRLRFATLTIPLAGGHIRLDELVLEELQVVFADGRETAVEAVAVRVGEVALDVGGREGELHDLVVEGLKLAGGRVETGPMSCRQLRGTWTPVDGAAPAASGEATEDVRPALDLAFLRHLDGHLRADITSKVDVPILGEWHAQHELRLEVREGRVEYRRLERGLGKLPDAVLDFNLRDGVLSFDRDIPLVPFDRTPLLTWPLSDDELDQAAAGWVALTTLARPSVEVEPKPEGDDEGTGWLRAIAVRGIDVDLALGAAGALSLPGGGAVTLGAGATPAIGRVRVTGQLVYATGPEAPPGQLAVQLDGVHASLRDLPAAGRHLAVDGLAVAEAQADLAFAGIAPTGLSLRLEHVRIRALCGTEHP